jgi:hypothetical protein
VISFLYRKGRKGKQCDFTFLTAKDAKKDYVISFLTAKDAKETDKIIKIKVLKK